MSKYLVVLFGLFLVACNAVASAEVAVMLQKLRVEAILEGTLRETQQVSFRIVNNAKVPVKIYNINLPWGARVNTVVTAVTKKDHRQLRSAGFAPETFVPLVEHVIDPGKSLSGKIPLTDLIDHASLRRAKEEVIVFWHYTAKGSTGESLGEYGGWLISVTK